MAGEPSCGSGLADNAPLPAKLGELAAALAENLEVHMTTLDQRARRELVAYLVAAPYARHLTRLGFGEVVRQVAGLHAEGRLREAPAVLPRELLDAMYARPEGLAGLLAAYRRAGAHPSTRPS